MADKVTMVTLETYREMESKKDKRIAELIALINAERERQEKCDDIHLRKIAELEKENAELKEKLKPENCLKLLAKGGYVKFTSDNLTKATELLKKIEKIVYNGENGTKRLSKIVDVLAEAEQFLKEKE